MPDPLTHAAIVLGVSPTGLAVARSLAPRGVRVYGVDSVRQEIGHYSRWFRRDPRIWHLPAGDELLEAHKEKRAVAAPTGVDRSWPGKEGIDDERKAKERQGKTPDAPRVPDPHRASLDDAYARRAVLKAINTPAARTMTMIPA